MIVIQWKWLWQELNAWMRVDSASAKVPYLYKDEHFKHVKITRIATMVGNKDYNKG